MSTDTIPKVAQEYFSSMKNKGTEFKFMMSIDTTDKKMLNYSLSLTSENKLYILLSKTMTKEKEFIEETSNLVKYFNANVIYSS